MNSRTHLRNLALALFVVAAMLLGSNRSAPLVAENRLAPRQQSGGFTLNPITQELSAAPGGAAVSFFITVQNVSGVDVTDVTFSADRPGNLTVDVLPAGPIRINNGSTQQVVLRVSVPNSVTSGRFDINFRVFTNSGTNERVRGIYTVVVVAASPTPSITPSPITPTATEQPLCEDGFDPFENNDNLDDAREIAINTRQRQAICTVGDEDWVFFSALRGKVYTIDIEEMDAGLDLSLELFNEDERQLAFNDDFFNRDPAAPNPNDLRPRIQSWTAPVNGLYYVRIRDAGGRGGTTEGGEREYVVALIGESYGPTPTNVSELCEDLFEPDGLPEQAREIVINEAQPRKTICPTGDADWVKFFATAGKRYILFTDTRPYRPSANEGTDTAPGTDTELMLTDRDGRTMIAFNDDIVGGNTFDSLLEFTVQADGIYYAQVKNAGDLGSQFFRYDLFFLQCLPEQQNCGRSRVAPTDIVNAPTTDLSGATPTGDQVNLQQTIDVQETEDAAFATLTALVQPQSNENVAGVQNNRPAVSTPFATAAGASFDQFSAYRGPDGLINGAIQGFADQNFALLWQRTDRAIAEQRVVRSWMWGPTWLMARSEPFAESPGGVRQVQYFEKGRMEVTNPRADRNSPFFVSSGLLVSEMVQGRIQTGGSRYVPHDAATVPVSGDHGNLVAPTYASFRRQLGKRADDRTGQLVQAALNRAGGVYRYRGPERAETTLVAYVEQTGHNIPQVFWDYLNARGLVWQDGRYEEQPLVDWVSTMGYPLAEPYWMWVTVAGMERHVLVQPFERRLLIYTPDNPSGFSVEMGNVGHHYYSWRYKD